MLVAVFVGPALAVSRRWFWTTVWASVALAAVCGPLGWWELLWLLD